MSHSTQGPWRTLGVLLALALLDPMCHYLVADDGVKRSSAAIAITADGHTVVAVNPDADSVSLVQTSNLVVVAELAVGTDPRTVAIADSTGLAYVANRGADTVSVIDLQNRRVIDQLAVGTHPYGVVSSPDGDMLFVAEQGDATLSVFDTTDRSLVTRIPVGDRPSGVAVTDDGATLLVTHLLTGDVTILALDGTYTAVVLPLWPDSNLTQSIVLSPDGELAYLPHTRSNTTNPVLTFDTTVFPLVSLVDVTTYQHLVGAQLSLDTIDPPGVGLPFDAAVTPSGEVLYVVNAASNDVTVVDLDSSTLLAHIEVENNPRGIVISPDGATAFVNNILAGTVSVIDTSSNAVTETIAVTKIPLPPALLLGKQIFHSSNDSRLSRAQWISCNTCHFEGEHDGRTWSFGFAGPRNTTTLHGMVQTYPLRWSAEWDESADSEFALRREQFGDGLINGDMHETLAQPNAGRSYELDCLAAFLDSLSMPENRARETLDSEAVQRGELLFKDPVVGCLSCHPPPYYTDFQRHDVATATGSDERLGTEIDTPGLRDLARSAPYLHDGSAATLVEVLSTKNTGDQHGVTSHLNAADLLDLETYLLALPANNSACLSCVQQETHSSMTAPCEASATNQQRANNAHMRKPRHRSEAQDEISGFVTTNSGAPVGSALVKLRATSTATTTEKDGNFVLYVDPSRHEHEVTAWSQGYYIASVKTHAPASDIQLVLRRHHSADNPEYDWVDPTPDATVPSACGNCHPSILPQWQNNAHGSAVSNPRFFSQYLGTDITGETAVTPGYLLDFPGTTGICATCHAPAAAIDTPFTTDMTEVRNQVTAGIHCDFCHKIGGAYLHKRVGEGSGSSENNGGSLLQSSVLDTYPNMPGTLSLRLLRPPDGDDIFFGPYADVHDPDSYLPLMNESAFCAPCHAHAFWGTPIYTSYTEWLASSYSDPETGQTCQACHMPPNGDTFFAVAGQGGLSHPAESIPSHLQLGASSTILLRNTVTLAVDLTSSATTLDLTVTVINSGAGHHVPTDHPGRHLLLVVDATDSDGSSLPQLSGPTVPSWGGSFAGIPGTGYAKVLRDVASGNVPVISYWKQAIIESDTRIEALQSRTSSYTFGLTGSTATVSVSVYFRRLFEPIAARYGWELGEVLMERREITVAPDG